MAAPNLHTLLDFESNIQNATKIFLETETGLSASSIFTTLDQDNFVNPRIGISFEYEGAEEPLDLKTGSGSEREYNKHMGNLRVDVISDGSIDATSPTHRELRGKVRAALLQNAAGYGTVPDANVTGFTITGADGDTNGTYTKGSDIGGKVRFDGGSSGDSRIFWQTSSSTWRIRYDDDTYYYSSEDTTYPWQVTSWTIADGSGTPAFGSFTGEDILPYYDVVYLKPGSTDFESDGDLLISSLNYEMKFYIKLDAWTS